MQVMDNPSCVSPIKNLGHWDKGRQDASQAFQARLNKDDMVCSMSREGKGWDNAPTESFFNSHKHERVHGARSKTRGGAIAEASTPSGRSTTAGACIAPPTSPRDCSS
jgi:transposase InsO family protein